jgi:hypothetical protein
MLDTSFTRTTGPWVDFIHPARRRQRVQLDGQDLISSLATGEPYPLPWVVRGKPAANLEPDLDAAVAVAVARQVTTKGNGWTSGRCVVRRGQGQVYQPKQFIYVRMCIN